MDIKAIFTVFVTVFLAELGDKTQLATMLYASEKNVSKMTVFLGASTALIVASGLGVWAGSMISNHINEKMLNYIAGAGFVIIGFWTIIKA